MPLPATRRDVLDEDSNADRTHLTDLFRQYRRTGDSRLREAIVVGHVGLVRSLAGRFVNRGEEYDDLVQVAFVGLLQAIDRFDPDHGAPFTSFAAPTILGELKRHFRDRRWNIRVPRPIQENYLRVRETTEILAQDLGRSPSTADIAAFSGLSEKNVIEALDAGNSFRAVPMDHVSGDRHSSIGDVLARPCPELQAAEDRELERSLLTGLAERERAIIRLRFGQELTQSQIAQRIGTSQMQVSRLLARSLDRLRTLADENDPRRAEVFS